jgi:ABC-type branched-subunit amino acid transport system ATPase component
MPLLECKGLVRRFGALVAVDAVDMSLEAGKIRAVIGPNGAGKSTLARLIAGELKPSAGSVAYDGRAAQRWPAWRLACKRSMLPQKS